MTQRPYGMICPITRACDILGPRWTIPILVALWAGRTRFSDIRREVGSISPALLARRLRELERLGLVERIEDRASGAVGYLRTEMAVALEPALNGLAEWAQRHIEAEFALATVDASTLMWKMRQFILAEELPDRRLVLQFRFADEGLACDTYWAVVCRGGGVEICSAIPGYEIDLFVETSVTSLGGILLGRTTLARERDLGETFISGDALIARSMERWLKVSDYARIDGIGMLPERRRAGAGPGRGLRRSA